MPRCRLLPPLRADGPTQMARDEALLRSAADGVASLRFSEWSAPTLSLGYFQPSAPALAYPGIGGQAASLPGQAGSLPCDAIPWLRRPSGGAALVHDRELTYCLALPAGKEWQGGTSWLVRFHRVVRDALAEFGIRASLCQAGEERKLGEVLCFLHHTPGDVILEGAKVVGSAQRKGHGALLQHGGILLGQSDHTPELPGIAELTGRGIAPAALGEVLARLVAREAGWALEPGEWTEGELEFAAALAAERYGSAGWNERR